MDSLGLSLADCRIDLEDYQAQESQLLAMLNESEEKYKTALQDIMSQRDTALADLSKANRLVDQVTASSSWRLTRPLRFAVRLRRSISSKSERRLLAKAARKQYDQTDLPPSVKKVVKFVYHKAFRKGTRAVRHYFALLNLL